MVLKQLKAVNRVKECTCYPGCPLESIVHGFVGPGFWYGESSEVAEDSLLSCLCPSTSLVWVTSRDHKTLSSWLKIFHLAWFFWLVVCQTSYMIVERTVVWWIPPSLIKSWIFRGDWYTFIWICHTIRHGTFNAFRMFLFSLEIELISISNLLLLKMFIFPLWWVDQWLTEIDRGLFVLSLMYGELSRNMWRTGLDVFQENTYIENRFLYMWLLSFGIAKV